MPCPGSAWVFAWRAFLGYLALRPPARQAGGLRLAQALAPTAAKADAASRPSHPPRQTRHRDARRHQVCGGEDQARRSAGRPHRDRCFRCGGDPGQLGPAGRGPPRRRGHHARGPCRAGTESQARRSAGHLDSPEIGTARLNLRAKQRELSTARFEAAWKSEIAAQRRPADPRAAERDQRAAKRRRGR